MNRSFHISCAVVITTTPPCHKVNLMELSKLISKLNGIKLLSVNSTCSIDFIFDKTSGIVKLSFLTR